MTVKDRINEFRRLKNLSSRGFESRCGLSNGYLRQLRNSPTADKIEIILSAFPELNREWLMTGEGEMMRSRISQTSHGNNSPNIAGDNNTLVDSGLLSKALDEISELRKSLCEALRVNQQNTDRLLTIIENVQS